MSFHESYSPSALARLFECVHSLYLGQGVYTPANPAADTGTLAHKVLEAILTDSEVPECPADMLEQMGIVALDIISNLPDGAELYPELRVDTGVPNCAGTADVVAVSEDWLVVEDFKNGRDPVEVENNPQVLAYLLGAVAKFGMRDHMRITIIQPFAGGRKSVEVASKELIAFEKKLKSVRAKDPKTEPPNPGDKQCKWCPAKFKCRAYIQESVGLGLAHPNELQPWEYESYYRALDSVASAKSSMDTQIEQSILKGVPIKGFKLIQGRGSRGYTDAKAGENLAAKYGVEPYVKKQKTVPQLEKELKKIEDFEVKNVALAELADVTEYKAGKPKVAYADAPGKDYLGDIEDELLS